MTSLRPYIGVQNNETASMSVFQTNCGSWILFLCKRFLLFQYICIDVGHMGENALQSFLEVAIVSEGSRVWWSARDHRAFRLITAMLRNRNTICAALLIHSFNVLSGYFKCSPQFGSSSHCLNFADKFCDTVPHITDPMSIRLNTSHVLSTDALATHQEKNPDWRKPDSSRLHCESPNASREPWRGRKKERHPVYIILTSNRRNKFKKIYTPQTFMAFKVAKPV